MPVLEHPANRLEIWLEDQNSRHSADSFLRLPAELQRVKGNVLGSIMSTTHHQHNRAFDSYLATPQHT